MSIFERQYRRTLKISAIPNRSACLVLHHRRYDVVPDFLALLGRVVCKNVFAGVMTKADADGTDIESAAIASLEGLKAQRRKVPGLGHPQH
ncbi:MAG: hypothetical protein KTR18_14975, partial [Acidiferrobacterales bacterium]|nr:hypothetical protein [Acidiferrobacterales bacterium]